ncbi:FkbM family methyltransferase [Kocuria palustris]|uniref:FkbM family methyltransferase n=1 Tax=Kocuria palustris TaxID=71999 RepID=UPI00119E9C3A|nr:FkbM family methyltransferase [Kocuria palustris]
MTADLPPAPPADRFSWPEVPPLSELPSTSVEADGRTWRLSGLDQQDHIFRWLEGQQRFYEHEMLTFLSALVPSGGLVADVGANIGNHAVWFAGVMGCRVRAFEPVPALCTVLAHNVAQNQLDARVRVEPYGVGRRSGRARVGAWDRANTGASTLELCGADGDIRIVALDDLAWDQPVDLLKIDVEGMEAEVLAGALGLIRRHRPVLAVEARSTAEEEALRAWLDDAGYHVLGRLNATPTLVAVAGGSPAATDAIAHSLEHLGRRFDDFETRLDRFGRFLHKLTAPAPSQAGGAPAGSGGSPGDGDDLRVLQERIRHLEAELDAMRRRAGSDHHDTASAEDRA